MEFHHQSVLLQETIQQLQIKKDGVYVDGTLGGGGHACEIAARLDTGRLIGIDRDEDALQAAGERLAPFGQRVRLLHGNYGELPQRIRELGYSGVDGIVLDLGVSSFQLDMPQRGFTYRMEDAILDMRMDQSKGLTAAQMLATYSEEELTHILRVYGEERYAKNIARNIVAARQHQEIRTAGQLNEIIRSSIPKKVQATGGHPAKRTYQAIRIAVNRELEVLEACLNDMIDCLEDGGRICIITFHSLEDRIVKTIFKKNEDPCTCPRDFPVCVCGKKPKGKVVTRKPIRPGAEETERNPRSKSAKLRVFERIVNQ